MFSSQTVIAPSPVTQRAWMTRAYWFGELLPIHGPDRRGRIKFGMAAFVFLIVVLAAVRAYVSGLPWMVFFQDDFYYYLKIAQNIAHGAGSTWNGIVPTNGYHPLWLLVLTGLSFFTSNGHAIFAFVAVVALFSTLATYFLAFEILEQAGLNVLFRSAFAAYIAIYAMHLFYTGMEIILAIPLMFLMMFVANRREFWQRGLWQASTLGLIASAMILSRLDLSILVALLVFWTLLNQEVRRSITRKQCLGLALGLTPLAAYFLSNHVLFGTWLPVSGMAKQLKFNHLPSLKPWTSVYMHNVNNWLNLLPIHLAVFTIPLVWKRLNSTQRVIFPSIILFPFLYFFLLSCVSDWQLWIWYLYPTRAALCVSFIMFCMLPVTRRIIKTPAMQLAVLLIVCGEAVVSKWWTDVQPPIYAAAVDIQQFARIHPGTYAMGDRSGMVAYLIPDPIVQTEGLVMDRNFLERVRRQDPLLPTLADYHVRYFVGTAWKPYTGCFHVAEPFQAGETSAHMQGDLCQPPVASALHEFYQTVIFDLAKEQPTR